MNLILRERGLRQTTLSCRLYSAPWSCVCNRFNPWSSNLSSVLPSHWSLKNCWKTMMFQNWYVTLLGRGFGTTLYRLQEALDVKERAREHMYRSRVGMTQTPRKEVESWAMIRLDSTMLEPDRDDVERGCSRWMERQRESGSKWQRWPQPYSSFYQLSIDIISKSNHQPLTDCHFFSIDGREQCRWSKSGLVISHSDVHEKPSLQSRWSPFEVCGAKSDRPQWPLSPRLWACSLRSETG